MSQWGSGMKVNLDGFDYCQVGVYENQQYLGYDNKLWPVWYSHSTGVLVPVEVAWQLRFNDGRFAGSSKFGALYTSSPMPSTTPMTTRSRFRGNLRRRGKGYTGPM